MRIAIEGCCHGELDRIYASLKYLQRTENITIDLLLICGDFQSIRNQGDLGSLACPDRYRTIGNFSEYYAGKKKAPIPTVFIGGNHEASNYLWELYHGGWVAENIYYMGFAGVVNFGGLRIGGLSGIYKKHDYDSGYYETQPFNESHCRSVYHVRKYNVYRLAQIKRPLDIMLTHDWPRGIAFHGNTRALLQVKPFLAGEINTNTLGSYPNEFLLKRLKPSYWFSAHLHVKFAAVHKHDSAVELPHAAGSEAAMGATAAGLGLENPDEIAITSDMEEDVDKPEAQADPPAAVGTETAEGNGSVGEGNAEATGDAAVEVATGTPMVEVPAEVESTSQPTVPTANPVESEANKATPDTSKARYTKFLALDKCLPSRDFLQIIDIPEATGPLELTYDEEWLAIMRATHDLFSLSRDQKKVPADDEIANRIATELAWVQSNISSKPNGLLIPHNFVQTAPAHKGKPDPPGKAPKVSRVRGGNPYINPQTVALCEFLGVQNYINPNGLAPGTWDPALGPPPPSPGKGQQQHDAPIRRVKLDLPDPVSTETETPPVTDETHGEASVEHDTATHTAAAEEEENAESAERTDRDRTRTTTVEEALLGFYVDHQGDRAHADGQEGDHADADAQEGGDDGQEQADEAHE
ncbi:lariat debranching enzyme, C-terminal domain-containing protein [Fimicolochytrium jonesii]|uniref:lariat debranching enzyme, C-terminal domain-containing protein n=1 Tax=Fimicolochytrium jonesii TaxID=1396493 RepID=UPI0022FE6CED|nr:lariat debranching enzyme, C-terminal domain-containing protein [Fimicolochytrium jonesii]KAI8820985.1 lariat debranching enzyme, C-terminal domain-containing protein [Fimicolochytrium jonesii]